MKRKLDELLERVTPNISIVSTKGNGKYPYCYSFFISGEKNILLDPNCDVETMTVLRDSGTVDAVVISHSHPDHMATAWLFNGLPVLCPRESPKGISDMEFLANRATGGGEEAELWKDYMRNEMRFRPAVPTDFYSDGDYLLEGPEVKLRAIFTPGHSRDHYVYFEEESGVLFSSDIDFTDFGPWYGYEECSIDAFRKSIAKIRELPVKMALSSHMGLITENIQEQIDRFEQGIERHKEKIRDLLAAGGGKTLDELVSKSPFYRIKYSGLSYMKKIEAWMVRHLLREMINDGEVVETGASDPDDIRYMLHF